jgi:hypothetical protein
MYDAGWVRSLPAPRAVELTPSGRKIVGAVLGVADPRDQVA